MNTLTKQLGATASTINDQVLLVLLIVGIVLLLILVVAALYLVSTLRRRNVILKKTDYLIEDITYKSESLNVTVETLNKVSNYLLSFDAISQKGFKSLIKLISENRNYIYAISEKLREDVESKTSTNKKPTAKKPSTAKAKSVTQETKVKATKAKTTETKVNAKKPAAKK